MFNDATDVIFGIFMGCLCITFLCFSYAVIKSVNTETSIQQSNNSTHVFKLKGENNE